VFHSDPSSRDDLYLMDGDGTHLRQLTHGVEAVVPPVWSPDGSMIAFVCCLPGRHGIDVVDADGNDLRRIAEVPGEASPPTWSPDGRTVAFSSSVGNATYALAPDGSGLRVLIRNAQDPAWSPDGSRLAFISERGGNLDIFTIGVDGTGERRLTSDPAPDYSPTWSPDGGRILFVSERAGNPDIYVMNEDGSDPIDLSRSRAPDDVPVWSPDGSRVAYVSYLDGADPYTIGDGNAEVFLVSADGSGRTNLTRDPAWDGDPGWSPDGSRLVFTRRAGHGQLFVVDADGSHLQQLGGVAGRANDCCAAWQP
jgi:Tol biopolymer transport system component